MDAFNIQTRFISSQDMSEQGGGGEGRGAMIQDMQQHVDIKKTRAGRKRESSGREFVQRRMSKDSGNTPVSLHASA